jgi:hypothetical protein
MKRRAPIMILSAILTELAAHAFRQDCSSLLDSGQVLDSHITMDPADWDALRRSCPRGLCGPSPHFYWNARFRCGSEPEIEVGIRRKNGTAEPSNNDPRKPALKIDINKFVPGQTYFGKTKINLENGGPSSGPEEDGSNPNGVREGVAWLFYGDAGIVTSRMAWVNDSYKGLYMHVEQVDKAFLVDHGIDAGVGCSKGPAVSRGPAKKSPIRSPSTGIRSITRTPQIRSRTTGTARPSGV